MKINSDFTEMFKELEKGGSYNVEEAKIDIAEQISLAMQKQNVSKAELSRRLGKSRAYVSKILQGGANFTIESLVKILDALDCTFDFRVLPRRTMVYWQDPFRVITETEQDGDSTVALDQQGLLAA
jgi:transcriptional regulator with XRE-family HTH domain